MRRYDLSGLMLDLDGIPPSCLRGLDRHWGAFQTEPSDETAWLTIKIKAVGTVTVPRVLSLGDLEREILPDEVRFRFDGACSALREGGIASMELAEPEDGSDYGFFLFLNILMPLLAWRLLEQGGLLLHAAGAVIDDRAFLLIGEENAGKTTWAGLCHEAGYPVVNDDVVMVRPDTEGRFRLHGVPLRVKGFGVVPQGSWPLCRLLFSRHGQDPGLTDVSGLLIRARLLANTLHLADRVGEDSRVERALEALMRDTAGCTLTFAKDTRFVELLRSLR